MGMSESAKEGCEAVGRAVVGLVRKENVLSPCYFESYPAKPDSPIKEVFYQMGKYESVFGTYHLFLNVTSIFYLILLPVSMD